ncbi:MDIS1-interacting receptor like kinase 2-like [Cornus florida]|uniref:MDIS1-interacting receptor like kinase 2-like n=1 Tax=Cornus florida TaxID=4283 RepID=UPI00289B90DA|nr:MDIS1-interacting receptor like kinase 2-like [Cornus florida]
MSRLQIPSFGRRKNIPPATSAAGATSSPTSASSSATISDTIPSTVAIDPVVSTPAANPSASPQITTTSATAGGARDKERGKRPHPDGGVNLEEEPLIRRTRVSGPSALLHRPVRAPAPFGPVAAGASASASASPSLPVLPPWAPRITTAPPTIQPLTTLHSSTVVSPIVTADVGPQQNDSVIHLDSPPREGEMADGTEEADRHNQEAVGNFPEDLMRLPKLSLIHLQDNKLSGSLSSGFGNFSNLIKLDLSFNGFSGTIPNAFQNLVNLKQFSAISNGFIGHLPPSLTHSPSISSLNLNNNSLTGPIVINCSAMVCLTFLDMGSNQFDGPIPDNLHSCQQLSRLNLA